MPSFSPPGVLESHGRFTRLHRGVSLLKLGGSWRQVREPSGEQLAVAETIYLGGYRYEISDSEAVDLTNAGYGEWVTSS